MYSMHNERKSVVAERFRFRFLKINKIEMYSMHNERKSVVAERFRFIKTLENKLKA